VSAGYSGTPLAKKLGIKSGSVVFTIAAPREYRDWLKPLPDDVAFVTKPPKSGSDVVHLFVASLAELKRELPKARKAMKPDGGYGCRGIRRLRRFRPTSRKTTCAVWRSPPTLLT
jgi:hypothetical protein